MDNLACCPPCAHTHTACLVLLLIFLCVGILAGAVGALFLYAERPWKREPIQ